LLLFELDPAFSHELERQFAWDRRVHVIHGDAARRNLLNGCDSTPFAEIAEIYGKFIYISQLQM
jgi:hypothetical protein